MTQLRAVSRSSSCEATLLFDSESEVAILSNVPVRRRVGSRLAP
jgi:hypothetical protein